MTPAVWDDASVDWERFDLSVVRSTWDYTDRRHRFVTWAQSVPRLVNPAEVIAWNSDKRYLDDLSSAGIPIVPTTWISTADEIRLPTHGSYVLKPAIGAGSMDAERFELGVAADRERALLHAKRLVGNGHTVMVQPYVAAIDEQGETSAVFIGGSFSHAVRKATMLGPAPVEPVDGLYKQEKIEPRVATTAELELATRTLRAVPGGADRLAYARVDMIPGADGKPLIMELELTEPSLFMTHAPGSEALFAAEIWRRASRAASGARK